MSGGHNGNPPEYRAIGIALAVGSGLLIGASFPIKKIGLKSSQQQAGEGVAYLTSPLWWLGMIMMILGEVCNFGAYAFVEALLVTPLGALSVCISAMLSHWFLKEKLTIFGWIGCAQCILGSVIIALNCPEEQSVTNIVEFKDLFLSPGFLAWGSVCIVASLGVIFFVAPKYGHRNMLWYIGVCSLIGGLSVSCTQGLGACILTTIRGENQFKNWFIYFLIGFVACTLLTEIFYLNKALALFNTAMVTPTYYVLFTFCTLVTSIILYQGLKATVIQIVTIAIAFLIICTGIFVLQMSRVDPRRLRGVDRRTSILLTAAREDVTPIIFDATLNDEEKGLREKDALITASEDPGMDALRGTFGAIGTISRAKRRHTIRLNSRANSVVTDAGTAGRIRSELRAHAADLRISTATGNHRPPSVFADSSSSIHTRSFKSAEGDEMTMSKLLAAEGNEVIGTIPGPATPRVKATSIRFADSPSSPVKERDDRHHLHHHHPYRHTHESHISEKSEPSESMRRAHSDPTAEQSTSAQQQREASDVEAEGHSTIRAQPQLHRPATEPEHTEAEGQSTLRAPPPQVHRESEYVDAEGPSMLHAPPQPHRESEYVDADDRTPIHGPPQPHRESEYVDAEGQSPIHVPPPELRRSATEPPPTGS